MLPEERKQIVALNDKLMRTIDIRLITSSDSRSKTLRAFSVELVENAPKIRMVFEKDDGADALPGLHIASSIVYHAVPHGAELLPFLDMLADISEQSGENQSDSRIFFYQACLLYKFYQNHGDNACKCRQ